MKTETSSRGGKLENFPTLPMLPRKIGHRTAETCKPGTEGESGEGLQLCIHVRASRADANPPHAPHPPRCRRIN